MDLTKTNQILRIAKMYHEENMSQLEIAQVEEVSKPTVCRLLKKAEELGFVKTYVIHPDYSTANYEREIKKRYNIKKVTVVPNVINNESTLIRDINRALLDDLDRLVKDGDTIGICWGNTMTNFAREANNYDSYGKKDITIVQLNGGASAVLNGTGSPELLQAMSHLFSADAFQLCAPAYVDKKETADLLKNDSQIKIVLDQAKECDLAIFSAGIINKESVIFTLGCLKDSDFSQIQKSGSVGDISSHFLNNSGELLDKDLDDCCMAVSLEDLKAIPEKILIAYGEEKADLIKAVLKNSLADRLYIDDELAQALLK